MTCQQLFFRFLESTGGAALLTVLFGTLGGIVLENRIQGHLQERESQREYLQARSLQALAAYENHLERERVVIENIYGLVGSTMVAAEGIIELAGPGFDRNRYRGDALERIQQQDSNVRRAYNDSLRRWRGEQHVVALQIDYYHPRQMGIGNTWQPVVTAVDDFTRCAEHFLERAGRGIDISEACASNRSDVVSKLEQLTAVLEKTRVYVWEGFETFKRMAELVEQ